MPKRTPFQRVCAEIAPQFVEAVRLRIMEVRAEARSPLARVEEQKRLPRIEEQKRLPRGGDPNF